MSSVDYFREFIGERLTAAAEEIFRVFKRTIIEYEEEIDRQRRVLDIDWKPEINVYRTELPQQQVCKEEEVLTDQQLCNQERNFSLDQEDPEPPQIKEEEEELCIAQEGEQFELKQETDSFMLIPPCEESDYSEDQTLNLSIDETQSAAEENPLNYVSFKSFMVSEPNNDHQLLSDSSQVADSRLMLTTTYEESDHSESEPKCDQLLSNNSHVAGSHDRSEHGDSRSTRNAEPKQNNQQHKSESHINNIYNTNLSKRDHKTLTGKKSFKCDTCGKHFKRNCVWRRHQRIHTGEKPYSCSTCGKSFITKWELVVHTRVHTGEKPYLCKTCGRGFSQSGTFVHHMRVHAGEKLSLCEICGKDFRSSSALAVHMTRVHTG